MDSMTTAEYLYCLVPGAGSLELRSPAVEGQCPVRVLPCGGFGVVASQVPAEAFCGEQAEQDLRDLAWLGPRVFRHEAVIEEAMCAGAVLPMRFATLFRSSETLLGAVRRSLDPIRDYFETIGDCLEWAVKGVLNRTEAIDQLSLCGETATEAPGARYFQQRRCRVQAERDLPVLLRAFCQKAASALCAHSSTFRERGLPPDEGNPDAAIVLNWAFLVRPAEFNAWKAELERLQGPRGFPSLLLVVTGPLPPYSFAPDLSRDLQP